MYPSVLEKLELTVQKSDLSLGATPLPVREEFAAFVQEGLAIAVGGELGVCSEKAKSEFIIAPLLIELRRAMGRQFCVFSGMELSVHKGRALNGSCDFVLTKGDNQHIRDAPIVGVMEAKNDEVPYRGIGQCVAAMVAALIRNGKDGRSITRVFGAVTTGRYWTFMRLEGQILIMDPNRYSIQDLGVLLGIIKHQIEYAFIQTPSLLPVSLA